MTLLDDLKWRGVLYDQTPDLDDHLAEGSRIAYCGFDPTADSLHVGSATRPSRSSAEGPA